MLNFLLGAYLLFNAQVEVPLGCDKVRAHTSRIEDALKGDDLFKMYLAFMDFFTENGAPPKIVQGARADFQRNPTRALEELLSRLKDAPCGEKT